MTNTDGATTLIKSLNDRISQLEGEKANLNAALKKERSGRKGYASDLETLKEQVSALTTERDTLKGKLETAPSELQQEVDRLRGEIRTRDHRDVFSRVAKAAGVRDEALEDLWSLSGYKAEADTPDEGALNQLVADAKAKRPYLFAPADSGSSVEGNPAQPQGVRLPATPPPPGSGRGAPDASSGKLTRDSIPWGDHVWMSKNQHVIAELVKKGEIN